MVDDNERIINNARSQYFKPLADDIAYYKRAKFSDSPQDHSFEFLWEAVTRYLRMKREDAMQEQLSRGINGASDKAVHGIDPKGKGHAKKGKDNRSRPKGGSLQPQRIQSWKRERHR